MNGEKILLSSRSREDTLHEKSFQAVKKPQRYRKNERKQKVPKFNTKKNKTNISRKFMDLPPTISESKKFLAEYFMQMNNARNNDEIETNRFDSINSAMNNQ